MNSLTAENIALLLLELFWFWHNIQNMIVILQNWSYKVLHKCLCKLIKIKQNYFLAGIFFMYERLILTEENCIKAFLWVSLVYVVITRRGEYQCSRLNTLTSTLENFKNEHLCAIFNCEFSYAHHWGGNKVSKIDVPLHNA